MKTPFDLEQAILEVWTLKEDIELIFENVCDNGLAENEDQLANALLGVATLHHLRCDKLFRLYEELLKEGKLSV